MTRVATVPSLRTEEPLREKLGRDLLQTLSALVTVFGFATGFSSLPAFLTGARPSAPLNLDILRTLGPLGRVALALLGTPIFSVLTTFLVISLARTVISLLGKFGAEPHGDVTAWTLMALILLPVAVGANLIFMVILFGNTVNAFALLCVAGSVLATGIFVFRWLLNRLF